MKDIKVLYDSLAVDSLSISREDVVRVKKFFERESIHRQLKAMVSFLIPHRSDVKLTLNIGGASYTDGKEIVVGLPEVFIKRSFEEIFTALRALVGHEAQHVNSSNFDAYVKFQEEMSDYFLKKYTHMPPNLLKRYVLNVSKTFGNGIEDGRIEKILGDRLKGYRKYLKFYNGFIWNVAVMKGLSELSEFQHSIVSLSVTGLLPKGFDKVWKGTEMEKQLNVLRPYINEGIHARTAQECLNICKEAIFEIEDYLVKLFEERTAEDEEMLKNLEVQYEFKTNEENQMNTGGEGSSIHFTPVQPKEKPSDEEKEEEESKKGSAGSSKEESEEKTGEEKEKTSSGSGKSQDSDEKEDVTSDKSDEGEEKDSSKSSETDGSDESDESSEETADNKEDEASEKTSSGDSDEDGSESEKLFEEEQDDSESIEKQMEEVLKELTKDIEEDAKEKINEKPEQHSKSKRNKDDEDYNLTEEDYSELRQQYRAKRDIYTNFVEKKGFPLRNKLPDNIRAEGLRIRKDVERILKNKEGYTLKSQKRGILDANNLWRLKTNDFNVFIRKGIPVQSDYVAYFLKDASGSMREDNKEYHAMRALAVLEEGFKGFIPFKSSAFTVDWNGGNVLHYCIKDFNENQSNINYAYNEFCYRHSDGGNKDGYSIRVATKELLKRPEKDKILVVLSDGIPTDYNGGYSEGRKDVKEAVREARRAGIFVVSIVFGSEKFRQDNIEEYRYMYEKNIISCDPQHISNQLINLMKKIIKH